MVLMECNTGVDCNDCPGCDSQLWPDAYEVTPDSDTTQENEGE